MSGVLAEIVAAKRDIVAQRKRERPLAAVQESARSASPVRGFANALDAAVASTGTGLIAEIKKASPSKGLIRDDFDPPSLAQAYAEGGAACLSVLTDAAYFQGADEYLTSARDAVTLPALRKDFMLEPYQVAESRALGADCVLVILAILDQTQAAEIVSATAHHSMDALVEVHDEAELERALSLDASLIGLNNRDLDTLDINLATTERLAALAPPGVVLVSESGLYNSADLERMHGAGVHRFLVGESLMRERDVAAATARLLGGPAPQAKAS